MLADFIFEGEGEGQLHPNTAGFGMTQEAASMRIYHAHYM